MNLSSPSSPKRIRDSSSDDELEPNSKRLKNDVFMNYSCDDIGKSFKRHLQKSLSRNGFTISDHTKVPVGEDVCSRVLEAIKESEIYVVIFSTKYAFSKESLDELVTIMDCHGKLDQRKILPVFFKVEPSDVRSQDGSFKAAFEGHETNINPETVQKWKQTLTAVGKLSGLTLKDYRDEAEFVSEIVKQLEKMRSPQELPVTDHPVGVGSQSEELISELRLDCEDVLVVGVFGISGIGKTTIVKATYNKIASKFTASVFLDDIHHRCSGTGDWKFELRKDLFSQLNKDGNVECRYDLVAKIQNLIGFKKTLLVLDDVDHFNRLEELGVHSLRFYKGSRIIVTTRDKDSLGGIKHTSYHTRLLNEGESRELFIRLMFARDVPVHTKFVEEVVARAGGLPLVLKVWSRHFIQYKEHLPEALKELEGIPHDDVQKKLQMSYDSLTPKSKNLFLDIACLFNGMKKDLVAKVLNDEVCWLDFEIEKLAHKFLVENKEPYLSMPHVIKEMGFEVVRQQNEDEPRQRTRLMDRSDVVRVFRDCSGTESIRSISLEGTWKKLEPETNLQLEAFKKMSNLRFLRLGHNSNLQWSSSSNDGVSFFSFKHLKYLEWEEFPCKSIDIDLGNVVLIRLSKSKLEKLWEGVKTFKNLNILNVSESRSLTKTGNFGGLENLEQLSFGGCSNLEELDSSIGCLQKLVQLQLGGCTRLKRFPWETISNLTSLQTLYLNGCPNILEISHEIGSLKSLKYLDLSYNNFHSLPDSICQLHQLTTLDLSYCTNLKSIPNLPPNIEYFAAERCRSLVSLVSLEYLGLYGNPDSFSDLLKLEVLEITGCSELQSLPLLPSNLKVIYASGCRSLEVMPFDSEQMSYTIHSRMFKVSNPSIPPSLAGKLCISGVSEEDIPEWCSYENSGPDLSFVAPINDDPKICGVILCAVLEVDENVDGNVDPGEYDINAKMLNKTKETSHCFKESLFYECKMWIMFYPLDDTTLVVEAGDTVELELQFNDEFKEKYNDEWVEDRVLSCGLRLIYEDDVFDSKLVIQSHIKPTLPLFPSSDEDEDEDEDDEDEDEDEDENDDDEDEDEDEDENDEDEDEDENDEDEDEDDVFEF